jgi:hypothetical protein
MKQIFLQFYINLNIIIIIIICYHLYARYLQLYTWKKNVSRAHNITAIL